MALYAVACGRGNMREKWTELKGLASAPPFFQIPNPLAFAGGFSFAERAAIWPRGARLIGFG